MAHTLDVEEEYQAALAATEAVAAELKLPVEDGSGPLIRLVDRPLLGSVIAYPPAVGDDSPGAQFWRWFDFEYEDAGVSDLELDADPVEVAQWLRDDAPHE